MAKPERATRPREEPERGLTLGFVARATLVVVALWALANMLWLGRDLLFIAFFAVLVSAFLSIFVTMLKRLGLPRGIAAVLVLVLLLAAVAGAAALLWPTLQEQAGVIRRQLPEVIEDVVVWTRGQYEALIGELGRPTAEVQAQVRRRASEELAQMVTGALPLLNTVVGSLLGLFLVVFTGLFLAAEPGLYARGLTRLLPPAARPRVSGALGAAGEMLRNWMLGTVLSMATVGLLTALGLWLVGVPAPIALGVIAGLLEFVPYFGPIMAAVPAVALALTVSPALALWTVVLYVVVQQMESNAIYPLIMRGAVELPPALTILFQILMSVLFGFLGLLLAVPILAAGKVLIERLYVEPLEAS